MVNRTLKTRQDCLDILTDLKLIGTGDGETKENGVELIEGVFKENLELNWIDPAKILKDAFSYMVFGSGSRSANTPKCEARSINRVKSWVWNKNYGSFDADATRREREMCSGSKGGALVSVELGTGNTADPVVAAARLGSPEIYGDYYGWVVPSDRQTTYFLNSIKTYRVSIVDWSGDVVIL